MLVWRSGPELMNDNVTISCVIPLGMGPELQSDDSFTVSCVPPA